ncbi:DUF2281 domain-containing protein [Synechococcus sp. 7002]|uniref:DUF2281 domain-containing protein n=1 Tax=Synechococcus sp. 7002 TaxID=1938862 RepID=UPI000A2ABC98|nr:DUF2281 domain-containing protein [Synechococcus sp. 7002]SMQ86550.1 hypothetical protein SAMN06272774_3309 [Synechococcus sp. 7002]
MPYLQESKSKSKTLSIPCPKVSQKFSATSSPNREKVRYGSLAGKLVVPDDFDEPLEELAEYM